MKIIYTKHAQKKISDLKIFGVVVTKSKIHQAITEPKYISSDNGNLIVALDFNKHHNIRVVYLRKKDVIIVITFYIYRKGRYGEN